MSADFPWAEIQNLLQAWALLALVTGLIVGLVVLLTRSPLPWQRRQHFAAVPWTFVDLALVLLLFVVGEYVIVVLMHQVRGPDAAPALPSSPARELLLTTTQLGLCAAQAAGGPSVGEAFMPAVAATAADRSLEVLNHRAETALWGTLISRLLLPVAFVLFLHLRAGARPYQVGLTRHAFGSSLLLGYLCWLVVTPLVFALFLGLRALEDWIGAGDPHLVQVLLSLNQGWQPWVLALIIAGLVAPLFEELLVRGIMQPLLVARPQLADGLVLTSLVLAVFLGLGLDGESNSATGIRWGPIAFLATVGPGYILFERLTRRWLPRPGAARALFASSLFFAAMHAGVWPTPIPLFFLSLVLGWSAYRTQSLVAPVTLHALFNLVSLLPLMPAW